jgi:hypothetical protein
VIGRFALVAALVLSAPANAAGGEPEGEPSFFGRVWVEIAAELDRLAAERARRPPVPVKVTWRARKIGSVDPGAPLLALEAADLDGDGRAELLALTTREVLVLESLNRVELRVVARAPLPPDSPLIRTRDPVGSLTVAGGEVRARTSEQAAGAAYRYRDGRLVQARRLEGYPICAAGRVELQGGRNYFAAAGASFGEAGAGEGRAWPLPATFYAARCRERLVDPEGFPISVFGVVDVARTLTLTCAGQQNACPASPAAGRSYTEVGVAFEIADLDNDGRPEVITTEGKPPGASDRVTVRSLREGKVEIVFARDFQGGVVALAAGALEADGAHQVVAAVRLVGSTRVDFWTLNQ